eukprot:CAMPEP_0170739030 /NCGR_PEP_ID=MMETSP0437-20130122/4951_1 /TAXON_ID=0 /ORGANISM="Sexangularia sp." /LENGTH=347 /DNA_ID=CAMNT_0011077473 /DNA_START=64 /DNA_END=1104 /DNA_ORIENTATION=+
MDPVTTCFSFASSSLSDVPPLLVIKIGGSFLLKDGVPDVGSLTTMAETINSLTNNHRIIVIVGGGIPARQYIAAGGALGANAGEKDALGIAVSRLNAQVFIHALRQAGAPTGTVAPYPVTSLEAGVAEMASSPLRRIVVGGGLQPGQSTTAVAALHAEFQSARAVIYATDVDGVYSADPRVDPTAKKLDHISYDRLRELTVNVGNSGPGQYRLMDGVALTILERSKLRAVICAGTKEAILAAVRGDAGVGTAVGGDVPSTTCSCGDACKCAGKASDKCDCSGGKSSCSCGDACKCAGKASDKCDCSGGKSRCGGNCGCGDKCGCSDKCTGCGGEETKGAAKKPAATT